MKSNAISPDFKVDMIEVGHKMKVAGLPSLFISGAVELSFQYEGVHNLMKMWDAETDQDERDEIVADIQGLIDDNSQKETIEGVYIRFDDLEGVAKDIRKFKDNLRIIVDQNGGIGNLAQLTGIPQPSLSRFFNSATMPRRATLLKIAKALNLSQVQIASEWSR